MQTIHPLLMAFKLCDFGIGNQPAKMRQRIMRQVKRDPGIFGLMAQMMKDYGKNETTTAIIEEYVSNAAKPLTTKSTLPGCTTAIATSTIPWPVTYKNLLALQESESLAQIVPIIKEAIALINSSSFKQSPIYNACKHWHAKRVSTGDSVSDTFTEALSTIKDKLTIAMAQLQAFFYNPWILIHVLNEYNKILDSSWRALHPCCNLEEHKKDDIRHAQRNAFWRHIVGQVERGLPGWIQQVLVQGLAHTIKHNTQKRSFNFDNETTLNNDLGQEYALNIYAHNKRRLDNPAEDGPKYRVFLRSLSTLQEKLEEGQARILEEKKLDWGNNVGVRVREFEAKYSDDIKAKYGS